MKILITGKRSYIANNLAVWLKKYHPYFEIELKSIRNGTIPSLKKYHVVIHCAGLVHKNEFTTSASTFMKVNTDLTAVLAKKAKESNVSHFIYPSTIDIYGLQPSLSKAVVISKDTSPNPSTSYAKSKLLAENELLQLQSANFKVAILRLPTVYGKNAPGHYKKLKEFVKVSPIFPLSSNQLSMINIANLCQIINLIITFKSTGIFHPQDKEYFNTSSLVTNIAGSSKNIYLSEILASVVSAIDLPFTRQAFGSLIYDKDLSNHFDNSYAVYPPVPTSKNKRTSTISLDL
jgi:nucleoside-diphosphate-sugar epimerase